MISIDVPGFYKFTSNKVLAVSSFCTFSISLINFIHYITNDNYYEFIEYDLFNYYSFISTLNVSYYLVLLFYVLDLSLTNTFWENIGEKELYVKESENPIYNNFIVRPMNSHSSIFLFFVGWYSLVQNNEYTKYYYACLLFSISQICMGIISYLWWASNLNNIHKIDNLCMELIVNSISTLVWTTIFPYYELYFIFLSIIYFIFHFFTFKKANLFELCIVFISGSFVSTYINGVGDHYSYFIGTLLTIGGLIPKIMDRELRFQLCTSIFHFMEAFGFLMFYKWIQTIPTIN
jgi:hypothetical protein